MPVVNDKSLDLIQSFEGFSPVWYADVAHGWKVPTCCYGHTDAAGEPQFDATKTKKFTEAEGRMILERDLAKYAAYVRDAVNVPLTDNQFGALVSFTFNLGPGNLNKSTLLKKLNASDYDGAAAEFVRWNRAGGKILKGLTRRRAAEAVLFRSGVTLPVEPTKRPEPLSLLLGWLVRMFFYLLSLLPKRKP